MLRRNLKNTLILVVIMVLFIQPIAHAATIGGIRCVITEEDTIKMYYQITGKGRYTVSLQVSLDGGKTFDIIPEALSGDVGKGIETNVVKEMEWDVFKDMHKLSGNIVVMISAVKEPNKPINPWLILGGLVFTASVVSAMSGRSTSVGGSSSVAEPTEFGFLFIKIEFPE